MSSYLTKFNISIILVANQIYRNHARNRSLHHQLISKSRGKKKKKKWTLTSQHRLSWCRHFLQFPFLLILPSEIDWDRFQWLTDHRLPSILPFWTILSVVYWILGKQEQPNSSRFSLLRMRSANSVLSLEKSFFNSPIFSNSKPPSRSVVLASVSLFFPLLFFWKGLDRVVLLHLDKKSTLFSLLPLVGVCISLKFEYLGLENDFYWCRKLGIHASILREIIWCYNFSFGVIIFHFCRLFWPLLRVVMCLRGIQNLVCRMAIKWNKYCC